MWLPVTNMLVPPLVAVKLDRLVTDGVLSCLKFENSPSSDRLLMSTALVATSVAIMRFSQLVKIEPAASRGAESSV